MKLVKDLGDKVWVEITQSEWVSILDALSVYVDNYEHQYDETHDEGYKQWAEDPNKLINIVPNDFLIRNGNTALQIKE